MCVCVCGLPFVPLLPLLALGSVFRSRLLLLQDIWCSVCISALYFLYLSLVKGALTVFDCTTNLDGVRILDADPAVRCDEVQEAFLCRGCVR
jgi:hypothetical protein